MSNKKLNIKSERLSRSLWLSDEFYVENVSEKIVGKIYKNAAGISDYINTGGEPLFPSFMDAPTSNCYGISSLNNDDVNFIFYGGGWTYFSISPESGKLFFMTPLDAIYDYLYTADNTLVSPASHIGETIVIVANYHEGSSDDNRSLYGKPIAAAPFKIVNYEQFKEYLAKPEPGATKYYEIETLLSEMNSYESDGGTYDLADCCFYILDESYAELCSASISSSPEERIDGLVHLFNIYRTVTGNAEFVNNTALRFSVFPVNSYNGAYANEAAYEIDSSDVMVTHPIVDDPTQPDGWYWDGLGWKAWGGDDLNPEEVQEIVNEMSLTNVTTGAFRLPTIDYGELLAEYDVSTSSSRHTASCPWIRIMKIPNFNAELIYNIIVPSSYDYLSDISDANYFGSLYLSWNYRLIPGGSNVSINRESKYVDQEALLKIDEEGYLWLSMTLRLDRDSYTNASYTAAEIVNNTTVPLWLNSLYIVPSIKTDGYECNWKNYLSSCTVVASDDSRYPTEFNEELIKTLTLYSTTALSNINCGGSSSYTRSFCFMFTPSVSGTYELGVSVANTNSSDITCTYKLSTTYADTTNVSNPTCTKTIQAGSSYNPCIFRFVAEADTPIYLYINAGSYYFNIDCLEIHGLAILNTTDEGAQMPTNDRFIKNTYYAASSYGVSASSTALPNSNRSGVMFGTGWSPIDVTF